MRISLRSALLSSVIIVLAALIGFTVYQLTRTIVQHYRLSLQPVIILAGGKNFPYHKLSEKYAGYLAAKGLNVKVCQTSGSMEILAKLTDAKDSELKCIAWDTYSQVPGPEKLESVRPMAGFVQGGLARNFKSERLSSLGRILTESLWLYYRCNIARQNLPDLAFEDILNQSVSHGSIVIGDKGSGTESLVLDLIRAYGTAGANTRNLVKDENKDLARGQEIRKAFENAGTLAYAFVAAEWLPASGLSRVDTIRNDLVSGNICLAAV